VVLITETVSTEVPVVRVLREALLVPQCFMAQAAVAEHGLQLAVAAALAAVVQAAEQALLVLLAQQIPDLAAVAVAMAVLPVELVEAGS